MTDARPRTIRLEGGEEITPTIVLDTGETVTPRIVLRVGPPDEPSR